MKKGFTLLEILLVIAAIGILAAIVIVAINPNRQLAQVRDVQRRSDINNISKALSQYAIDNSQYPEGIQAGSEGEIWEICSQDEADCTGYLNLQNFLVPTYVASIPSNPNFASGQGSGYYLQKVNSNRFRIYGLGELQSSINSGEEVVNPIQDTIIAWYDLSDLDTLTLTGQEISAVEDKSGQGNNLVAVNTPTLVEDGLGGKSFGQFNGTDEYLETIASVTSSVNGGSIFAVAQNRSTSSYIGGILGKGGSYGIFYNGIENVWVCDGAGGGRGNSANSISGTQGPLVVSCVYETANTQNTKFFRNGDQDEDHTGTGVTVYIGGDIQIGGRTHGGVNSRVFGGDIAEVIYYDRTLSDDEVDQVVKYLRIKFNIQ